MSKLRINLQLMLPGRKSVQKPVVTQPRLDAISTEATNKFQLRKKDMTEMAFFILDEQDHPVSLEHAIDSGLLANGMTVCVGQAPHSQASAIQASCSTASASLPPTERGTDDEDYYDAEGSKLLGECAEHHSLDVMCQHPETKACLYCGNIRAARTLETLHEHGITHIVNCTANLDNYFEAKAQAKTIGDFTQESGADRSCGISYFRINMSAHAKEVHTDEDAVLFVMPMLNFVHSALCAGSNVLVHCKAGAHRAGTAAIICLMHFEALTMLEAIAKARRRRVAIEKGWGGIGSFPLLLNRIDREWERDRRMNASASYDVDYIGIDEANDDHQQAFNDEDM